MSETEQLSSTFGCTSCGSDLKFEPGTTQLHCEYCGAENEINVSNEPIRELGFVEHVKQLSANADTMSLYSLKCESCGATTTIDKELKSAHCTYCSNALIVEDGHVETFLRPQSLLPFELDTKDALLAFNNWRRKLWFAPNDLKKVVSTEDRFKGVYLPYWTYDTDTDISYTGSRGEHYYVTENYTTRENGKTVSKSRRVRKTRWYSASGRIRHFFDDILVAASNSLPRKYLSKLEPWDLHNLVPFDERFLSGYTTEKYQMDLEGGFDQARIDIRPKINHLIEDDIGGDEQRIYSKDIKYSDITFKHLLLPTYISSFKYKEKVYRFVVNARTGEVQGERPYSWIKITIAVILGIIVLGVGALLFSQNM